MQIKINNEKIDFTLEKERVLGEVVDGIQDWLHSNGFTITGIRKDESDLTLGARLDWQDDPVAEIDSLDITAHHPMDLAYDKLYAAVQYLHLIEEDGNPDSPLIKDLLKGAADVAEMIDDVTPQFGIDSFGSQFMSLAEQAGLLTDGPVSDQDFTRFLSYVSELVVVLSSRIREISDPETELKVLGPALKASLSEVSGIAVLLQTGNDREALMQLIKFIEMVQKLLRVVLHMNDRALLDLGILEIDGGRIGTFTAELNGNLTELSTAMENGDSVLIGDLLEYEIEPKLSGFLAALDNSGVL